MERDRRLQGPDHGVLRRRLGRYVLLSAVLVQPEHPRGAHGRIRRILHPREGPGRVPAGSDRLPEQQDARKRHRRGGVVAGDELRCV